LKDLQIGGMSGKTHKVIADFVSLRRHPFMGLKGITSLRSVIP
jgi:hypothetical protein